MPPKQFSKATSTTGPHLLISTEEWASSPLLKPPLLDSKEWETTPQAWQDGCRFCCEGRSNHKLRFVYAYNPCYSTGLNTVYQQHVRYLDAENRDETPHVAFEKDFKVALSEWIDTGNELVVSINANQDVRKGCLQHMFKSLGMYNAITTRHPQLPMPATHARNNCSKPIDAIFTTINNPDMRCGYLPFQEAFSGDHRPMWIDIPKRTAWGHNPPHLFKPTAIGMSTNGPPPPPSLPQTSDGGLQTKRRCEQSR